MSELIIRSLATATEAAQTLLEQNGDLRQKLAAAYLENEQLVIEHNHIDEQLAAANARAEAAEAKLAAVPVEAIRRYYLGTFPLPATSGAVEAAENDLVDWLNKQPEVQA